MSAQGNKERKRKAEDGPIPGSSEPSSVRHAPSDNQVIRQVRQVCGYVNQIPVKDVRNMVQDLFHQRKIPAWVDAQNGGPIDAAPKRKLCAFLGQHLGTPLIIRDYTFQEAETWCDQLSIKSVAELRNLLTHLANHVFHDDKPDDWTKDDVGRINKMRKSDLCKWIGEFMSLDGTPMSYTNHNQQIVENVGDVLPEWMVDSFGNQELITHPMVVNSGQTYDKQFLRGLIQSTPNHEFVKCPQNRQKITSDPIVNHQLKIAIDDWLMTNLGVDLQQLATLRESKDPQLREVLKIRHAEEPVPLLPIRDRVAPALRFRLALPPAMSLEHFNF